MTLGMGYFIWYVWQYVTKKLKPTISASHKMLINLLDQIRMLDNDLIRLQQKVNTVVEYRKQQEAKMKQITYLFVVLSLLVSSIYTSEVVHKFKSPSFSGISTSSHYLTIENQQKSRRDKIADDLESAIAAERDADGTTQAKFLRNLESRIYAQISKQLVDKMFGTEEVDRD